MSVHRRLISETVAPEALKPLYRRPVWRSLLQMAAIFVLLSVLATLAATSPTWTVTVLFWPLIGFIFAGFLNAAHDCVHGTFLDGRRANRIAGTLWCAAILGNFSLFKYSHLTHHRYTRVPGDTEAVEPLRSIGDYARRMLLRNPFGHVGRTLRAAFLCPPEWLGDGAKRAAARQDASVLLIWLMAAAALTIAFPATMVAIYWGPLLFAPAMVSLTALPEHYGRPASASVFESTASVISNPLARTLLWNAGYHAEHHLYPAVPSQNLPALHQKLRPGGGHCVRSYSAFHAELLRELWRGVSSNQQSDPRSVL